MQKKVSVRFYEELNDFLEPAKRKQELKLTFEGNPLIKDLIKSLGVPTTAVDLILVNGQSVPFSYTVQNKDRISVYPVFETFNISKVTRLRGRPLRDLKFIVDTDLGELADCLRLFGFDVFYKNDYKKQEIVDRSVAEKRVILTKSRALLLKKGIVRGYRLKQTEPQKQFDEIINHFDLK